MKILVTGSAGFIGSHLCRELADHGHDVSGHDMMHGDLTIPGVFLKHLDKVGAELVVHLAAQVGRVRGEDDVAHTVKSNVTMSTLIAHACGKRGVPVVYTSTSEIYGDHGDAVCEEDTPWRLPHNLYGLTKRQGEEVMALYAPEGLKIIRPSMPYGPGVPPGRGRRALDNILWQAHHRMPIPIHRGAERSWCWIGDLVEGIRLVIENGEPGAYNVGRDDQPTSMFWLARKACRLTEAPADLIELVDPPAAQTVVKRLSTDKLRALGWEPKVELDEGMPQVLEWVKRFDRNGVLQA